MIPTVRRGLYALRPLRFLSHSPLIQPTRLAPSQALVRSSLPLSNSQKALFSVSTSSRQAAPAAVAESTTSQDELTRFDQLQENGLVDKAIIDVLVNRMNIHTMTDVQRMTLNHCLDGTDVIGQARTGTGKTIAFLMPIVQRILKDPELKAQGRFRKRAAMDIKALIISPTRELAEQIAVEAKKIVSNTSIQVQTAVGGTQKSYHLREMQRHGCHILVGTPGRVLDILQDPMSGVNLDNIETFVMDEADRLLDIGFAPAIEEIQSYMPNRETQPRQTLMFSATVPKSVVSLVRQTLRPDFKFIRTVDPDEAPTHQSVPQKVVFAKGLQNYMPVVLEIAQTAMEAHEKDPEKNIPFKAIVYFSSTNEVGLAAEIFTKMRNPGTSSMFEPHPLSPCAIFQMSSKLDQRRRTRESEGFGRAKSAILFSSDVTARGMDFPNVSHVIQIGPPKQSDDYVHRIGRTGRAGKPGQGWLIVSDDERQDIGKKFRGSGITLEPTNMLTAELDMTRGAQVPSHIARNLQMIESGVKAVPHDIKAAVYTSLLGVLQQQCPDRPKQAQIDMMNELAKYGWGLQEPPAVPQSLIEKLGFGRCDGLNFAREMQRGMNDRRRSPHAQPGRARNVFDERDPFGQGMGSGKGVFGGSERGEGGGRDPFGNFDRRRNDRGGRVFGNRDRW